MPEHTNTPIRTSAADRNCFRISKLIPHLYLPHYSSGSASPFPLTCFSGSTRPSGRTTLESVIRGAPDLAGWPVTVILSPNLNTSFLNPAPDSWCGLPNSAPQCSTFPLSSVTSKRRPQCGLVQIHSVTVPVSVTFYPSDMQ